MAVNLHTKFRPDIEQAHTLNSLISGKLTRQFDFTGVNSIKLSTILTQALGDYSRSSGFTTAVEVADYFQEFTLSLAKQFNLKIDALNASDQSGIKAAGPILQAQMKEQVTPYFDQIALRNIAWRAGKSVVLGAAISKTNIIGYILDARKHFTDNLIPDTDRYLFVRSDVYALVLQSSEFIAVDTGVGDITMKGVVGKIAGFWVVETPLSYFTTDNAFIAVHKDSALSVIKLDVARIIDSEDFVGKKLQGLFYGDAFVVGAKANGVYAGIVNGSSLKVANCVITPTGASHAITCATGSSSIYYTLDGSDPRFSNSRVLYASAVTLSSGQTIKAYALKANMFDGDVASAYYA